MTIILASNPNWSKLRSKVQDMRGMVWIESDAWIGVAAIFISNVAIGKLAKVCAAYVSSRELSLITIVAGNLVKMLRRVRDEKPE